MAVGCSGRRGALVASVAVGVGAAAVLADDARRSRLERTARVWRLTVRRSASFALVRLRGRRASEEERARLEERFAIRSAEDVARELGNMKGAIMKAGQMLSFIVDGLPPEAQAALATLQADVPPMAPSLAEGVVRSELGDDPDQLFLDWDPVPVAAASIGQVHRAVLADGRVVAVKVQYPGLDVSLRADLDNAELLYGLFSAVALNSLDVKGLVDELRARMVDELDYRLEARAQRDFAERYEGHPFIRIPEVIEERSSRRVITCAWAEGQRFDDFLVGADVEARQRAAEIIFRFTQDSVHRALVFNGDPHPGNYRFGRDGSVTFLDFGLVKRWSPSEHARLLPVIDPLLERDAVGTAAALVQARFLRPDHALDPKRVWEYVSGPYVPYLDECFTYRRDWTSSTLARLLDVNGPYADVIRSLDLPPSFVILDRVVWGVSALLGRLDASGPWRAILAEYRSGAAPATPLGEEEAVWRAQRHAK